MRHWATYLLKGGASEFDTRARTLFEDHVFQVARVPTSVSEAELAACKSPADLKALMRRGRDRERERPSGRRINERPRHGGPFISVDSEGANVGPPIVKGRGANRRVLQKQRTILWMAGGSAAFPNQTLAAKGRELKEGLNRETVWEWLLSLPRAFAGPSKDDRAPIFVGFGFSYDVGQLVAGMPYRKAWELHNGVPWDRRNDDDFPESLRRWVLCGGYAISHIPRKSVVLCKLRNRDKPWKWSQREKTGGIPNQRQGRYEVTAREIERVRALDWIERIEIYDTHGFFQSSLLKAIEKFPGVVTAAELEIIKQGKAERGAIAVEDVTRDVLSRLKRYTAAELKALSAMMESLRGGFNYPDPVGGEEVHLKIRNWWGAGAIAQALLKQHLGLEPRGVLGDMSGPWFALDAETGERCKADALYWAFHARFGGRIELCKQGVSHRAFYVYDISSAYPAIAVELPSMEGGRWLWKKNPTRAEVEGANILSVFKVKTRNFNPKLPFYPLPFRTETGSIMFPPEIIAGRYMRDDVIAAFKWFDHWNGRGELCDYSRFKGPPEIIVEEALFFIPSEPASRPLAFIRALFDWRASLPKGDMRGQVIKLGINSVYGKFAQRVGKAGEPPTYGCLWYAAAITAGTRRKIMEGALTKPRAVAGFATDALFSVSPLPLDVPAKKTLGEWEFTEHAGAAIVQSGVYVLRDKPGPDGKSNLKIASRGFNPSRGELSAADDFKDALERELFIDVPKLWREGGEALVSEDQTYIGLGAAAVSPKTWPYCGYWKTSERELRLNAMSAKRTAPHGAKAREQRASSLVDLGVTPYTVNPSLGLMGLLDESAPSIPNWANVEGPRLKRGRRIEDADEDADDENVNAGLDAGDVEF